MSKENSKETKNSVENKVGKLLDPKSIDLQKNTIKLPVYTEKDLQSLSESADK